MNTRMHKLLAVAVFCVSVVASAWAGVELSEVRFRDGDFNTSVFCYVEEEVDMDYTRYESLDRRSTVYYHQFGNNNEIVTGTVENDISKSIHMTFKPDWYIGDTQYYNVFVGFYDNSLMFSDNDFRWFKYYDESDPTRLYCEDYNWDTEEDVFYTASAEYDKKNRLTHLIIDGVAEVWVTYSTSGKIASYKDTIGYEFTFSPEGRCTMLSYPNGRKETMTWTKRGLEESRTFADGTKYTNTYDSRSRLSKRTYSNGAVINYEYDAKGKLIRQYTQLSDSSVTFDEVTYTWNDTGLICIEKHTNGPSYLIQYDDYEPENRHWKYRIVEPNTLTEITVAKLPTDFGMFESQWNVATHGIFADGDTVYLLPYNEDSPGYRYQNQQVTAMDLPITSDPAGNTKTKDNGRYGDFILVGNLLFYKDFSTPVTLDYEGPDWFYDALRSNYQYYQAWHDGKYILPKGIVFVEEYSRTDNLFAVEFEDGKPVKFIHREDVDEWVASQEGGFTLEQGMIYGSYYQALYKDGYLYSHFSPIYGKKYRNDVDAYVGSINDQFSIWEIYGGSYAITNKKGDLLTYFTVPKSETKKYNFDFNEKGQLYAVTTPEYTSKTHYYEDDYAIEYIFVEGSTGEIVTFNGYLESFGTFTADAVELKELPSDNAKNLGTYGADTTFFIMDTLTVPGNKKNATSTWYEVQLCDGTIGFVPESSVFRY